MALIKIFISYSLITVTLLILVTTGAILLINGCKKNSDADCLGCAALHHCDNISYPVAVCGNFESADCSETYPDSCVGLTIFSISDSSYDGTSCLNAWDCDTDNFFGFAVLLQDMCFQTYKVTFHYKIKAVTDTARLECYVTNHGNYEGYLKDTVLSGEYNQWRESSFTFTNAPHDESYSSLLNFMIYGTEFWLDNVSIEKLF